MLGINCAMPAGTLAALRKRPAYRSICATCTRWAPINCLVSHPLLPHPQQLAAAVWHLAVAAAQQMTSQETALR